MYINPDNSVTLKAWISPFPPMYLQWLERLQLSRRLPSTSHAIEYQNPEPCGLLRKFGHCSEKGTVNQSIAENHPLFQSTSLDDFQIHPPSNGLRGDKRPFQAHTPAAWHCHLSKTREQTLRVSLYAWSASRWNFVWARNQNHTNDSYFEDIALKYAHSSIWHSPGVWLILSVWYV